MAAPGATRVDIDTRSLLLSTWGMSTREIGKHWLALLRGDPSEFETAIVRKRTYAAKRVAAPNWQTTRERILARDGRRCTYCGSDENLECDHIVPVSRGGGHGDDNLTTACRSCNRSKSDRLLEEWSR